MNSTPTQRRRVAIVVSVLFGAAALTAGALASHHSDGAAQQQPQATPVMVATVVQADIATWDEFSGRLEAVERVDVRSRVAGAVQQVHFEEGARVKTGELLVTALALLLMFLA